MADPKKTANSSVSAGESNYPAGLSGVNPL